VGPVLLVEGAEVGPGGEALLHEPEGLEHAADVELLEDVDAVEEVGLLAHVGLDAADELRVGDLELAEELAELLLELLAHADEGELALGGGRGLVLKELGDEGGRAHGHEDLDVRVEGVVVLVEEAGGLVADGAGVVADEEGLVVLELLVGLEGRLLGPAKVAVLLVALVDLGGKALVVRLGHLGLLVQEGKDADLRVLDDVDAVIVVEVLDLLELDALLLVNELLLLEDLLVEVALELLVTVVDAELLERVDVKVLEAGNIQHTDVGGGAGKGERRVDAGHEPVKEAGVEGLGEGVAGGVGLPDLERLAQHGAALAGGRHGAAGEGLLEDVQVHADQARGHLGRLGVLDGTPASLVALVLKELDVSNVEHGRNLGKNVLLLRGSHTDAMGERWGVRGVRPEKKR